MCLLKHFTSCCYQKLFTGISSLCRHDWALLCQQKCVQACVHADPHICAQRQSMKSMELTTSPSSLGLLHHSAAPRAKPAFLPIHSFCPFYTLALFLPTPALVCFSTSFYGGIQNMKVQQNMNTKQLCAGSVHVFCQTHGNTIAR